MWGRCEEKVRKFPHIFRTFSSQKFPHISALTPSYSTRPYATLSRIYKASRVIGQPTEIALWLAGSFDFGAWGVGEFADYFPSCQAQATELRWWRMMANMAEWKARRKATLSGRLHWGYCFKSLILAWPLSKGRSKGGKCPRSQRLLLAWWYFGMLLKTLWYSPIHYICSSLDLPKATSAQFLAACQAPNNAGKKFVWLLKNSFDTQLLLTALSWVGCNNC